MRQESNTQTTINEMSCVGQGWSTGDHRQECHDGNDAQARAHFPTQKGKRDPTLLTSLDVLLDAVKDAATLLFDRDGVTVAPSQMTSSATATTANASSQRGGEDMASPAHFSLVVVGLVGKGKWVKPMSWVGCCAMQYR